MFATALAITLNLSEPHPATWSVAALDGVAVLERAMNYLAAAALPTGLLLGGATVTDDWKRAELRHGLGPIGASVVLRLLLLPAISLPLTAELRRVLVLQAAMPAAVFPIVLARHFGGDVGVGLRILSAPAYSAFSQCRCGSP